VCLTWLFWASGVGRHPSRCSPGSDESVEGNVDEAAKRGSLPSDHMPLEVNPHNGVDPVMKHFLSNVSQEYKPKFGYGVVFNRLESHKLGGAKTWSINQS